MNDLARLLFAAVMGASVTAALLIVPTIARGAKGAAVPAITAAGLLAWLSVAVGVSSGALHHVAVAPALAVGLSALWLGVGPLRRAWEGASMAGLVGLQALRFTGGLRVLAASGDWLPERYGTLFGAADVALAAAAVALSWAWSKGAPWARRATLAWAALGGVSTLAGLVVQARLVRPMPGFEGLWTAFLTPVLFALLMVAGYRARVAPSGE
ncbi:MAG: hypothetical protein IPN17_00355 [Deltaproteobacteria bacterium]|nr:hypothetical protein [Deltaproteobacteria bacterium]MBK7064436.1 hypothetical protein [Deltaproteobacteria bacterium]MBK8690780.1 hypothetical protein [Deltaproteobacteria bacterium]MBP6829738.1 hypothetical protein [Deltaproteobacteria bacterium]